MSTEDVEIVRRWRRVSSAGTLDRAEAEALLTADVEWIRLGSPARGREAVLAIIERQAGSSEKENLDVEFDPGELEDLGDGRISAVNHQVFRWKETGEIAYERRARIDYTIRDGAIVRFEATMLGDPEPG